MSADNGLNAILKNHGYSTTTPRRLVFEALQKYQPVHVSKLASLLAKKIDKASVYRTVSLFERLGVVQRVWLGFKSHIELSEAFSAHHHHLTCLSCGTVIAIEDKNLENTLENIAERFSFIPQYHQVEVNGLCLACQQKVK